MFHLSVKPVSRSAGRSAVAAAAYRSATLLEDRQAEVSHDYTRKRDVVHSEIVAPAGAPSWAFDRSALWNAAEAAEKRRDACVARDYEVAIPKGLTREQGIELVRDFSLELVDRYGVAVDFNIHRDDPRKWDGSEKGWQGYHAHILTTTRRMGPEGLGAKSNAELSPQDRQKRGLLSRVDELKAIRVLWETTANRHLERVGSRERIDSRSLEAQGIDREATIHLGPYVTELERRGVASDLGNVNRDILAGRKLWERQGQVKQIIVRQAKAEPRDQTLVVDPESLAADRVQWVCRVIERADQRVERRQKVLDGYGKAAGVTRVGVAPKVREEWERAKARAAKLVEQARALAARIRELLEPRRLQAWAEKMRAAIERLSAEERAAMDGGLPARPQEQASRPAWIQAELDARRARQRAAPAAASPAARDSQSALERLAKKTEQIRRGRDVQANTQRIDRFLAERLPPTKGPEPDRGSRKPEKGRGVSPWSDPGKTRGRGPER